MLKKRIKQIKIAKHNRNISFKRIEIEAGVNSTRIKKFFEGTGDITFKTLCKIDKYFAFQPPLTEEALVEYQPLTHNNPKLRKLLRYANKK